MLHRSNLPQHRVGESEDRLFAPNWSKFVQRRNCPGSLPISQIRSSWFESDRPYEFKPRRYTCVHREVVYKSAHPFAYTIPVCCFRSRILQIQSYIQVRVPLYKWHVQISRANLAIHPGYTGVPHQRIGEESCLSIYISMQINSR